MMELKNNYEEHKSVSVLQGDELCISKILARVASVGRSSRTFYRPAEGVPFKWESNPGTPKHPQEKDRIQPPPSPSPLMQSRGLTLPNMVDDHDYCDRGTKESALRRGLRKLSKSNIVSDISKKVQILGQCRSDAKTKKESSRFGDSNGEFVGSVKGSSFSSDSSFSTADGPFCCNPLEVHAVLDEGNTKIYYCNHHKTAFAVEQDNLILSTILSRGSASDQFSGPLESERIPARVPFRWETRPGTPKHPTKDAIIPPPPVTRSMGRSMPIRRDKDYSTWKKTMSWKMKNEETDNVRNGISCREEIEFEASYRRSGSSSSCSSVASKSRGSSKMRSSLYGSYFNCFSPWGKGDFLVNAKRKIKSFTSY